MTEKNFKQEEAVFASTMDFSSIMNAIAEVVNNSFNEYRTLIEERCLRRIKELEEEAAAEKRRKDQEYETLFGCLTPKERELIEMRIWDEEGFIELWKSKYRKVGERKMERMIDAIFDKLRACDIANGLNVFSK